MLPDARNPIRHIRTNGGHMADTQFSLAAFMRLPMQQKLLSIIALSMVAAIVVAGWTGRARRRFPCVPKHSGATAATSLPRCNR
jgi:hypothetical protein